MEFGEVTKKVDKRDRFRRNSWGNKNYSYQLEDGYVYAFEGKERCETSLVEVVGNDWIIMKPKQAPITKKQMKICSDCLFVDRNKECEYGGCVVNQELNT